MDNSGNEINRKEIVMHIENNPINMIKLTDEILSYVQPDDIVGLEGYGYASKQGFLLGGIGWIIRTGLIKMGVTYYEIPPNSLKKFATGVGNADKRHIAVEVNKRWGFFDKSDNVTDAFVLAQMVRSINENQKLTKFQTDSLKKVRRWQP